MSSRDWHKWHSSKCVITKPPNLTYMLEYVTFGSITDVESREKNDKAGQMKAGVIQINFTRYCNVTS